ADGHPGALELPQHLPVQGTKRREILLGQLELELQALDELEHLRPAQPREQLDGRRQRVFRALRPQTEQAYADVTQQGPKPSFRRAPVRESADEQEVETVVDLRRRGSDEPRNDEDGCWNSHLFQQRECIAIEVLVAIVEGDGGERPAGAFTRLEARAELV